MSVLKFAAHRQLTRWANKRELSPRQHAQRVALLRAVRVLEDSAFAHGCELRRRAGSAGDSSTRHVALTKDDVDA